MQNINSLPRESFPRSPLSLVKLSLKKRFLLGFPKKMQLLFGGLVLGFVLVGAMYFIQAFILMQYQSHQVDFQVAQKKLVDTTAFLASPAWSVEQVQAFLPLFDALVAEAYYLALDNRSADITAIKQTLSQYLIEQESLGLLTVSVDSLALKILADAEQLLIDAPEQGLAASRLLALQARVSMQSNRLLKKDLITLHDDLVASNQTAENKNITAQNTVAMADVNGVYNGNARMLQLVQDFERWLGVREQQQQHLQNLAVLKNSAATQLTSINAFIAKENTRLTISAKKKFIFLMAMFVVLLLGVFMGLALAVYQFYCDAGRRVTQIKNVIKRINNGKSKTRIDVVEHDDLGKLSAELNRFLDKHFQLLDAQSSENEQLNNSIITLIRAVSIIARKDLTVKVPVSVDITGSISDAVNLLTSETARTLALVKNISEEVDRVADVLHGKSHAVLTLAEQERIEVMAAVKALEHSTVAMNEIASKAGVADVLAKAAIANTRQARISVEQSFDRILTIKSTMSETEKRIKRLGDRSQEVSGIVNLINTIAERTHILALNASMHAASAGEAGKGFALVAAEVQRLAENVREATADIASMVHNIRIETSDAVIIMNRLIMEVAEGTKIAEMAGQHMNDTDLATHELVSLVSVMGENAIRQAVVTQSVRDRANVIRDYTQKTGAQLLDQNTLTNTLKMQSEALVEQVGLFKLPEAKATGPKLVAKVS